jgi:hypothetical protein
MKRFEETSSPMPMRSQSPSDYSAMLRERGEFDLNCRMGYFQGYVESLVWRVEQLEKINTDLQERLVRLEAQLEK